MKISAICVSVILSYLLCSAPASHSPSFQSARKKEVNEIVKGQKIHGSSINANLRCGSCDVCPTNSNIISGRDKVVHQGGDDDDEEGEGGD